MVNAHDVCSHLRAGTVIVREERSVILVVEHLGDHILVNPFNGHTAEYHEWFRMDEEVELFEDLEEWILCTHDKKPPLTSGTDIACENKKNKP